MNYLDGKTIKQLRERRTLTQRELSLRLNVSDKTVSKWETGRGLPDISILSELSEALGVSLTELMTGSIVSNCNRSANMLKTSFYVCPVCGNIIHSVGDGSYSCCGITLPKLDSEPMDGIHSAAVERLDGGYYVHLPHEMTRAHYISFIALLSYDTIQLVKLYPEQDAACRFDIRSPGILYAYCNRDGLFSRKI